MQKKSLVLELTNYMANRLGDQADHGVLAALSALSGVGGIPFSMRTYGPGLLQGELASAVADVIPSDALLHITSAREEGFYALEATTRCLILEGAVSSDVCRRIIQRLVRRLAIAKLGPNEEGSCVRFDGPLAVVLVDNQDQSNRVFGNTMMTIRVAPSPATYADRQLRVFTSSSATTRCHDLVSSIGKLSWRANVVIPGMTKWQRNVATEEEAEQLRTLLAFIRVHTLAKYMTASRSEPFTASERDVEDALRLLDRLKIEKATCSLSPGERELLDFLQDRSVLIAWEYEERGSRYFSAYNVMDANNGAPKIDTCVNRLRGLEQHGLVTSGERHRRRNTWALTVRGKQCRPQLLTTWFNEDIRKSGTPTDSDSARSEIIHAPKPRTGESHRSPKLRPHLRPS